MKFRRLLFTLVSAIVFTIAPTLPTSALTELQSDTISDNCSHIRQSLKSLQKSDSAMRVHLGTTYQAIITNYITPLNLRLVRNNIADNLLNDTQADFVSVRSTFNEQFIKYSQQLEELISTDCHAHPDDFYQHLESTRAARAKVAQSVVDLRAIIGQHYTAVVQLQGDLSK